MSTPVAFAAKFRRTIYEKQKKYKVCFDLQFQPLPLKSSELHPQNFVRYSRHQSEFSKLGVDFFSITTIHHHIYCAASVCNISSYHINCVRKPHSVTTSICSFIPEVFPALYPFSLAVSILRTLIVVVTHGFPVQEVMRNPYPYVALFQQIQ